MPEPGISLTREPASRHGSHPPAIFDSARRDIGIAVGTAVADGPPHRSQHALLGESPGGIAPPGAPRTGRDSLPSSGSHHPAIHGRAPALQWANSPGSRPATLARSCRARRGRWRSRLYFRCSHRTRYVLMRLSSRVNLNV